MSENKEVDWAFFTSIVIAIILLCFLLIVSYWARTNLDRVTLEKNSLESSLEETQNTLIQTTDEYSAYKEYSEATISQKDNEIAEKDREIYKKASEIAEKNSEIHQKANEIEQLQYQLTVSKQNIDFWKGEFDMTYSELKEAESKMESLNARMREAHTRIFEILHWVGSNAYLSSSMANAMYNDYGDPTSKKSDGDCTINTYQMGASMRKDYGGKFGYLKDPTQEIYTLAEFWEEGVGDCDDFSLFVAAWLRYEISRAASQCNKVWLIYQENSYEQAEVWSISDPRQVCVVCGLPYGNEENKGHCEVAVTTYSSVPIVSPGLLRKMKMFASQTGEYKGQVDDEFEELWFIITTDDFIVFDRDTWSMEFRLTDLHEDYLDFVEEYYS